MATAKKLPSGSWRIQIFDYQDSGGKKHYRSFTARTRKEAERMAANYQIRGKSAVSDAHPHITIADAIKRYIGAKNGSLSPSTIRGYKAMERNYYKDVADKDIFTLTSEDMQLFVSSITPKVRPKTVANIYGLLYSSVLMLRPDAVFRVTLPKKVKYRKDSPSDADIKRLFEAADGEMKLCIGLAAFGSLRRGEICALKRSDIEGNRAYVHADLIRGEDAKYVYKEIPKTSDSVRVAVLPEEVIRLIPKRGKKDDFIVSLRPDHITYRFGKLRKKLGINIRFHDLRHYFASVGAALGIPDIYLSDFGGWRRNSGVMKEVYQNSIKSEHDRFSGVMVDHFSSMLVSRNITRISHDKHTTT